MKAIGCILMSMATLQRNRQMEVAAMTTDTNKPTEEEWFRSLFERLVRSNFRSRFHLSEKEKLYVKDKGMEIIESHAGDFVKNRLSDANPSNDGKQTPMRGHPVFVAQHATATCCRGCIAKWHKIPAGRPLTERQQEYLVKVIMTWIKNEMGW